MIYKIQTFTLLNSYAARKNNIAYNIVGVEIIARDSIIQYILSREIYFHCKHKYNLAQLYEHPLIQRSCPRTYNYVRIFLSTYNSRTTFRDDKNIARNFCPNSNNFGQENREKMKPDPVVWIVLYNVPSARVVIYARRIPGLGRTKETKEKERKNPVRVKQ